MRDYSLREIADIIKGEMVNPTNRICKGHSIDTRSLESGDLFWALKGDRFDGHDFIMKAWEKGASAVVVSQKPNQFPGTYIYVDNTLTALQTYAGFYREKFTIPIIGITGSHGKTTTKDMTTSILKMLFNVHKTHLNLNGLIGVPLTLLGLTSDTEVAVIEIGISKPGEMSLLSSLVKPTIGVLTGIGETHTEFLSDPEQIFIEKSILFSNMYDNNSIRFLNIDDEFARRLIQKLNCISYGFNGGDFKAEIISMDSGGSRFFVSEADGKKYLYKILIPGRHNVLNATAAIAIARHMKLTPELIQNGLNHLKLSPNRSKIFHVNSLTIIDDSYNAAPKSMLSSLQMLKEISSSNRTIAILGDMLELGKKSREAHEALGYEIISLGIDLVLCFGQEMQFTYDILKSQKLPVYYFTSKDKLLKKCISLLKKNDYVLIKASRSMHAEQILKGLLLHYQHTNR